MFTMGGGGIDYVFFELSSHGIPVLFVVDLVGSRSVETPMFSTAALSPSCGLTFKLAQSVFLVLAMNCLLLILLSVCNVINI